MAGSELHRLLFPVGDRQAAGLRDLASGVAGAGAAFLAWHRGIAYGLEVVVREAGARGRLADWLLLRDEPVASDLLWGGHPEDPLTRRSRQAFLRVVADQDLGDGYCRVVAPDLRHRLGEHYTPRWLVDRIVDALGAGGMTADPACGDGRFLVALLARGHDPAALWGADLNPLAVVMARVNVWLALGRPATVPPVPVVWADFVLGPECRRAPEVLAGAVKNAANLPPAARFLGNPPWVTWRNLGPPYRAAVAARMAGSRLHHTRGWTARVAAGQADLAHVFVHEAVERVAPAGRLAFVLPRTVFKAPVGPGRLREGVSTTGRSYRVDQVWDCVDAGPFTRVRTDAVVGFVRVDQPPAFPVAWTEVTRTGRGRRSYATLSDPADPGSPWLTGGAPVASGAPRWHGLRARGGINTGGGNGVFYVEVLARGPGTVTIRNLPSGRQPVEAVTAEVEAGYVRPLLRGRDVAAWRAHPSGYVVLPHDPADLRRPVPEPQLAATAPATYAYLRRFHDLLAARRELRRWRSGVWYTLFRIGPYTAGCWRVVWPHSANGDLRAALLRPDDPAVPDQKVVLVPFPTAEPALFLCALLNCPAVRQAAAGSGGIDASPNLLRRLVLPRFDGADAAHREVVDLARRAVAGEATAGHRAAAAAAALFSAGAGASADAEGGQ